MQRKLLGAVLCCIGSLAWAENIPCLIFSGSSEKEYALDLSRYSRITFGENSMTVSDPKNPTDKIELLYSAYHHLEVGMGQPSSGLEEVVNPDIALRYDSSTQTLNLEAPTDDEFIVGVFNLNGVLVCHTQLQGGQGVSLETLASGVYIAVATSENGTQKLKFVK